MKLSFDDLRVLSLEVCSSDTIEEAIDRLCSFQAGLNIIDSPAGWWECIERVIESLETGDPGNSIFSMKGNQKLPFACFSTLPGVTCPGAGDCLEWCYSFKSWKNPPAFCRQLQNTLFLKFYPVEVALAFQELPEGIDVRLYVDGDIDSKETLEFWLAQIESRPDLSVYGYSKSWDLFLAHHMSGRSFPGNYLINISGGSRYEEKPDWKAAMLKLEVVRGEFLGVPVDNIDQYGKGFKRYESKKYHQSIRDRLRVITEKTKVISCPGNCGTCGAGKHFCGDKKLKGITIGIGIH